jgi:glycosyltransferase involved in cell wall biosynthesis
LNVLLITFSFPPAGGVGVLRALSLAKYLPENGIRVDVLTARNAPAVGQDLTLLKQVPESVTVHRAWTLDLPFALRKAIKTKVSSGSAKAVDEAKGEMAIGGSKSGFKNSLKKFIGDILLPDPQVGWLPFAFPAARRLVRKRKIDLVLITVPPFSTVGLVSKLRKSFPRLPIVLDFRDEWLTTTINLVSFNKSERAREIARQWEAEAVHAATAVVAVTQAARDEIAGRYPMEAADKFQCVPNGYDTRGLPGATTSRAATNGGKTILTYIGTVYGSTDPATFVSAVVGLPEEVRSRLLIRFIGHIETPAYREMLLSLGESIELKGFVPQSEALRAIDDTTYLLLITRDRINVAAKFYDYLGGGKPILGAVHPEGDVRRLLEETRTGWWADISDVAAIRRMLIEAVERQPQLATEFHPDAERVGQYHRSPLAKRYASLLKTLAAPGTS